MVLSKEYPITTEQPTFPAGYDINGVSLYYNFEATGGLLASQYLYLTRVLRFGNPADLELVDLSSVLSPAPSKKTFFLKEYIRTSFKGVPVYIFDEHNHAFFAWCEALTEGNIQRESTLIHIDAHSDGYEPSFFLPPNWNLKQAAEYAQFLEIDTFINPAIKLGIVKDIHFVEHYHNEVKAIFDYNSSKLSVQRSDNYDPFSFAIRLQLDPRKPIVDLDLDFFEHNGGYGCEASEIASIRELMSRAGVVTMATSPGFINQHKAIALVKELLK